LDLVKFCPGGGRAGRLQFDKIKTTGHIEVWLEAAPLDARDLPDLEETYDRLPRLRAREKPEPCREMNRSAAF
jgi:hypothetical protein